jgi:hypothetical protein
MLSTDKDCLGEPLRGFGCATLRQYAYTYEKDLDKEAVELMYYSAPAMVKQFLIAALYNNRNNS